MTENKFKKPECWNDDERMNALFQPFRPKQVNPHHYNTKLAFWQDLIYKYCKHKKGDPIFSRKEVQFAFKRKERLALCLETIIEEMINQKLIQRKDVILNNPHNTWSTWAVNNFVKSPVKWGFNKILGKSDVDAEDLSFCHMPLLKELSDELMHILSENPGKVLRTEDLLTLSKSKLYLNDNGLNICLFYLHQQNKILIEFDIVNDEIQINLIKIPGKDGSKEKFTAYDKSMIQLRETKIALLSQIEILEKEISKYQEMARKCVSQKNQRMAKVHLKRKLVMQNQCDKKSNTLHNIETLLTNMEDAQSNGEILSVYKMGSETLKSIMSKSGLTLESVDEIMSTMKEVTEEHDEIQNTMSSIENVAAYDDDSLEEELKEILGENDDNQINFTEAITTKIKDIEKEKLENELISILENLEVESKTPNISTLSTA